MEIKTTYNIGDSAFVIYNNGVYKCEIEKIFTNVNKEKKENINYVINIEIPIGLLKKEYNKQNKEEKDLFCTLGEAEEYVKYIEKAKNDVREFDGIKFNYTTNGCECTATGAGSNSAIDYSKMYRNMYMVANTFQYD